jgi:hypothetical protein
MRFRGLSDESAAGWAGVIAGALYLIAQMIFVALLRGESAWFPLQRISAFLLGPDVLPPPAEISQTVAGFALLIHFILAFCFGRMIALVVRRLPMTPGWVVGAACGLGIYVVNFYVLAPLIFPWFVESQGGITLLDHALFGVTAALAFAVLRRGGAGDASGTAAP